MKTITGSVVKDQLFIMLSFGLLMGVIFPFFTLWLLRLPASRVLTPLYFSMCIMAGLIVRMCNYFIFRNVVYKFLSNLAARMALFQKKLEAHRNSPDLEQSRAAGRMIVMSIAPPLISWDRFPASLTN